MSVELKIQPAEQPLASPKAEPKAEKSEHKPRNQGVEGPQRGPVVPGVVDFKVVYEKLRTTKPETPGTYRFGRLSHNSFFSRHHPHPHRVTHIKDFMGKPVCVVKDKLSLASLPQTPPLSPSLMKMPTLFVPIGDPQSNRDPQLSSEAWKKELKNLASQVVNYTKEKELKNKEEEVPQREQGAKYSAETGRLIPASSRALSTRHSRQGRGSHPSSRDGIQAYVLQDPELLILELLCQILQTDSLSAIQFWLLYSPPKEKALALGLLQTAVAQLLPQGLDSIPTEKLLSQLQDVQEPPPETQQPNYSLSPKKSKTLPLPKSETPVLAELVVKERKPEEDTSTEINLDRKGKHRALPFPRPAAGQTQRRLQGYRNLCFLKLLQPLCNATVTPYLSYCGLRTQETLRALRLFGSFPAIPNC